MSLPPLTPECCDLRGYEWMPLFGERLFSSQFEAHATDIAFRVAIKLYWECWQQVPAASLPNDDVQLCRLAGLGRDMKTWRKLRADGVLHGFRLCSDDRLYHGMLAEEAIKAWDARQRQQAGRDYERDKKRRQRGSVTNNGVEHVPRDRARCPPGHPPGQTAGSPGTNGGTNPLVPRDVPRAVSDRTEESKKESLNLTYFGTPLPRARGAEGQTPSEPSATGNASLVAELEPEENPDVLERDLRGPCDLPEPFAVHVRHAATALTVRHPYGEVRSLDAQRDALAAQPAAVGADIAMGLRWQPAEPVRSVEEQMRALLADCTPEQIARAKRYARA